MLNAYGLMLVWLFSATIALILIIAVPLIVLLGRQAFPPFVLVVLSGALGAFISCLSRLYSLTDLPALLMNSNIHLLKNKYVIVYSLVPSVVGIVAAAVVYVAVEAGVVSGSIFPEFTCTDPNGNCNNGIAGLEQYGPKTVKDLAKALVMGFLCGFSERFFPGVIESLSSSKG